MKVERLFASEKPSIDTIALRNGVTTARLVAQAAFANNQSLGTHYRLDAAVVEARDIPTSIGQEEAGRAS